jgi:hypothetical protein
MKKKIPIGLRKIIDEVYKGNESLVNVEFGNDFVVKFKDSDIYSDYFFIIHSINHPTGNSNTSYSVEYNPHNRDSVNSRKLDLGLTNFKDFFLKWKTLLVESNEISPIFDDYFTQTYYEDIEGQFEIIDEDANYKPFRIAQQLRIIDFLDKVENIIETESSDETSQDTIVLIKNTKEKISSLTKNEVIKRIRIITAKGFKMGLEIGQKLLIEFTTELAKKLITG